MCFLDGHASFFLLLENDFGSFLIESDAEPLQLAFNYAFVSKRLLCIEHNKNQVASARNTNNLLATAFAVFCAFDDTWQVQKLDLSAFIVENTRDASECSELVSCSF